MDWLRRHHGTISYSDRAVALINHQGLKVECHPNAPRAEPMVCSIQAIGTEEVPIVREYPDVFPKELPGMPPVGVESDQHVNICSFAVRCDQRWPSTQ